MIFPRPVPPSAHLWSWSRPSVRRAGSAPTLTFAVVAALAACLIHSAAAQEAISFNLAAGETTGAISPRSFAFANWNNLTTDYDGSGSGAYTNGPSPLSISTGSTVPLRLWWDATGDFSTAISSVTGNDKMMLGYLDSDGDSKTGRKRHKSGPGD